MKTIILLGTTIVSIALLSLSYTFYDKGQALSSERTAQKTRLTQELEELTKKEADYQEQAAPQDEKVKNLKTKIADNKAALRKEQDAFSTKINEITTSRTRLEDLQVKLADAAKTSAVPEGYERNSAGEVVKKDDLEAIRKTYTVSIQQRQKLAKEQWQTFDSAMQKRILDSWSAQVDATGMGSNENQLQTQMNNSMTSKGSPFTPLNEANAEQAWPKRLKSGEQFGEIEYFRRLNVDLNGIYIGQLDNAAQKGIYGSYPGETPTKTDV